MSLWRPSSIVLACILALCILPGVMSFSPFFPNSNMFSNIFTQPAAHPANFFHQNLFPAFFNFPQQAQPTAKQQRQQEVRFPSALECRSMCLQREEHSLANAKYRSESDGNGGLNLFIEFQDNGEPISMKNVNLRVREDIFRRIQLHPFGSFSHHLGYAPEQPNFILDVSMSRQAPVPDQRSAWCGCASPNRVEEYAKAFALPQFTDLSNVHGQLLLVDDKTIALKVHLPKITKTLGKEIAAEKNAQMNNHQKQWAEEQEQQKRVQEQALAEAEVQAAAQRKAAAAEKEKEKERLLQEQLKEQLQQILQQREQQQLLQREQEQRELRERERAAQLERQRQERVRQEQQQRERQLQQERQRQLEAEAAAKRAAAAAAAAEAEAERLLAERKERAYRNRFGGEGEVIRDLGDVNARQNKKYAQLSEERRQWKDSEVVFLD